MKNKVSRRKFVQSLALAGSSVSLLSFSNISIIDRAIIDTPLRLSDSRFLKVELNKDSPGFSTLSLDSLGGSKFTLSPITSQSSENKYRTSVKGMKTEYRFADTPDNSKPAWSFEFSEKSIKIKSEFSSTFPPQPLVFKFDPKICHVTLLGLLKENQPRIELPALMHFPDMGTLRVSSSLGKKASLLFDASRYASPPFVMISFDPANAENPSIHYELDVVSIYPEISGIENDARFDGYRRNYLNIFQINPRLRTLANHASSDIVPFTVYEYGMMAMTCPPLADGLTAMDLLRQTLDHYFNGKKGYGQVGYATNQDGGETIAWPMPYDSLDTYPSLIIGAAYYFKGTQDKIWLNKHYATLQIWANKMLAMDMDGDGLIEFPITGNAGSYNLATMRTSNWWDAIGFGHKDAYSNAMAYNSLEEIAILAKALGKHSDMKLYEEKAKKLKNVYYPTFYNHSTGVLAGWKSTDGKLHDYYFTFVQAYAIYYGLVDNKTANELMDKILAKMKEVGYTDFSLGLPGNLIPIRKEDYLPAGCCGAPVKDDGTDAFQIYENGGATACHVYFFIESLYKLGRKSEADEILFPMLKSFEDGKFQGFGANGKTNDWKKWDGTTEGYEGFLVDGYLTLLSVQTMMKT
jgi:hypothetical protein